MKTPAPGTCPPLEVLEELAAESVSSAELDLHLASCADCRAALAEMQTDNQLLAALRGAATRDRSAIGAPRAPEGYELVREIGRGGQGVVYSALRHSDGARVAVKMVMPGRTGSNPSGRFAREGRLAQRLDHPNVVRLFESGTTVNGDAFLVMELVEGVALETAAARLRAAGVDGTAGVLTLFLQICAGVEHAHGRGVLHRDLKPANILVDADGKPHILDFGLAKEIDLSKDDGWSSLTSTGQLLGSLAWMAPEQVRGEADRVGHATDVHALGLVLYRLLTGRHPYSLQGSVADVLESIPRARPELPGFQAGCEHLRGSGIEAVVSNCLEKEPEDRYASVADLVADCLRAQRGERVQARTPSRMRRLRRFVGRRPTTVGVTLLALATLTIFLADRTTRGREAERGLELATLRATVRAVVAGDVAGREEELWRAHLAPPADAAITTPLTDPALSGPALTFWGLFGLYAEHPCRASRRVGLGGPLALSPLSRTVAIPSVEDATIVLLRADSLEPERAPLRASGRVRQLVFRPGTRELAAGGAGFVDLFDPDAEADVPLRTLHVAGGGVLALGFVSDTLLATLQEGGAVLVWDLAGPADAAPLTIRASDGSRVHELAVLESGRTLACAGDGQLELWSLEEPRLLSARPSSPQSALATNAAGSVLLETRHRVRVFRPTGEPGDRRLAQAAEFDQLLGRPDNRSVLSPDGRLAVSASGPDHRVQVWDVASGSLLHSFASHEAAVANLALSADGRGLATLDRDGVLKLWDLALPGWPDAFRAPEQEGTGKLAHGHTVMGLATDGTRLVTAAGDGVLKRWDLASNTESAVTPGAGAEASCVALRPGLPDEVAFGSYAGSVALWSSAGSTPPRTLTTLPGEVNSIAFDPSGTRLAVVAGNRDGALLRVLEVPSGRVLFRYDREGASFKSVHWEPDGERLVFALRRGGLLRVRPATGEVSETRWESTSGVHVAALHPAGGVVVTGHADGFLSVWSEGGGAPRELRPERPESPIYAAVFSPDGTLCATGDAEGSISLWLTQGWVRVARWTAHDAGVFTLAFTPDGQALLSGAEGGEVSRWRLLEVERRMRSNLDARRDG